MRKKIIKKEPREYILVEYFGRTSRRAIFSEENNARVLWVARCTDFSLEEEVSDYPIGVHKKKNILQISRDFHAYVRPR